MRTTVAFLAANILVFIAGVSELIDYERFHEAQMAILNVRTLIFAGLAAYAGGMSYVLYRGVAGLFESARTAAYGMFVALNAILVVWGLVEISDYYSKMIVYVPVFNPRMVVMLLGVAFAGGVAYLFYKRGMQTAAAGYFITAHVLLILLGTAEILDYHFKLLLPDVASYDLRDSINQQASMYVTGYLVLYGFIALVSGLLRRFALLRNIAIATLLVAITKVFLFDIRELDEIYRIVALLVLGIALLVVGYLYYKYKDRTESSGTITPDHHA
jgi:uncharacterized membrane protein